MSEKQIDDLSEIFRLLGQPVRMRIMLIIAHGQACVCHIEAVLGIRQAAISQHLIALRRAGLVLTVREGRNIFYRLANPSLIELIYQFARTTGVTSEELERFIKVPVPDCTCPYCNPDLDPELTCRKLKRKPQT